MVNINIEIPDELHKRLKLASLLKDTTLKDYIITTLEREIATQREPATKLAARPLRQPKGRRRDDA